MTCTCTSDLLIIGGGPAGLSAAINGASEGLSVRLIDAGVSLGGQARESSAIENYPGFPAGITGDELMGAFARQARKFDTSLLCPTNAARLTHAHGHIHIITDDYQEFTSRSVLIAIGLSYRRLTATGIGPLMGRGVWYGMPPGKILPTRQCNVAVVGGANSAGQAVLKLASNPKVKVKLIVRKTLEAQMSEYLVIRIRDAENIEVCEGCEVVGAQGDKKLESIHVRQDGGETHWPTDMLLIFIGATPKTLWLDGTLELDERKFIRTWHDVRSHVGGAFADGTDILPYETSIPGVFAAGDVRAGSTKRIATAIGEGAAALQMVHQYLGAS